MTKAFYLQASNRVKPDSPGRGVTPSCLPPATLSQKETEAKLETKYVGNKKEFVGNENEKITVLGMMVRS